MKIAICDDMTNHSLAIEKAVAAAWERLAPEDAPEIERFRRADELKKSISSGDYMPQIACLDIQLDGQEDGIALAGELNRLLPDCRIIFVTSYLHYATDVYDADHVFFVMKSELETRMEPALKKAIDSLRREDPSVLVSIGRVQQVIHLKRVVYLERALRRTRIVCKDGEYVTYREPGAILAGTEDFIRCHRSFWVHYPHIEAMRPSAFQMSTGTDVPISRNYSANAREAFFRLAALRER